MSCHVITCRSSQCAVAEALQAESSVQMVKKIWFSCLELITDMAAAEKISLCDMGYILCDMGSPARTCQACNVVCVSCSSMQGERLVRLPLAGAPVRTAAFWVICKKGFGQ